MKAVIFDSGTLINLSINGLLDILEKLRKSFSGKFIITEQVKYETVDRPIGISRFELGALRVQKLIDEGILELPHSLGVSHEQVTAKTKEIMNIANQAIQYRGRGVPIVSEAEMSCLALSELFSSKEIENLVAIDERTTRILVERPENLEKIMSEKMHRQVILNPIELERLPKVNFIRSSEIVFVAYKKGLVDLEGGKKVLEALLYATKFKGSSISFEEIDILKKL